MKNPVAKNCKKFNRSAVHVDRKKSYTPDVYSAIEEYFYLEELLLLEEEDTVKDCSETEGGGLTY